MDADDGPEEADVNPQPQAQHQVDPVTLVETQEDVDQGPEHGVWLAPRSDSRPRWGHRADAAQAPPRSEARSKRSWDARERARGQRPL